jgi:hypothetical protein
VWRIFGFKFLGPDPWLIQSLPSYDVVHHARGGVTVTVTTLSGNAFLFIKGVTVVTLSTKIAWLLGFLTFPTVTLVVTLVTPMESKY